MSVSPPVTNQLTSSQGNVLAKVAALNAFLNAPDTDTGIIFNLPKNKQITTYDYLKKLFAATVGVAVIDLIIKQFFDKLFDVATDKLERYILKAIAASLDAQNITISKGTSNNDWLIAHVLPEMHVAFSLLKAALAKQILMMIFGPKENMGTTSDKQQYFFDQAVCSDGLFSMSNNENYSSQLPNSADNNSNSDIEYNRITLQNNLQQGQVNFIISCQSVKIQLPQAIIDNINSTVSKINSDINVGNIPQNPSSIFDSVSNFVTQETQRINTPKNSNAINQSFQEVLAEKSLNLIPTIISTYLGSVFATIAATNPNIKQQDIITDSCTLQNTASNNNFSNTSSQNNSNSNFDSKSKFTSVLINSLYSALLTIMIKNALTTFRGIILNGLKKKLTNKAKLEVKNELFSPISSSIQANSAQTQKASKSAQALSELSQVFKF